MITNRVMITDKAMSTTSVSRPRGFTLVETLVGIAILMVTLVGPFMAVEHALTASYVARDELTGSSIAQEAVEYVLNMRGNNYLYNNANPGSPRSWLYGVDGTSSSANCFAPNRCIVDPLQSIVQVCNGGNCGAYPLYIGSSVSSFPYVYNQTGSGTVSRFTRSIQLTSVSANEAKLTVTVTWSTNQQPYTTTIVEYIQNWL